MSLYDYRHEVAFLLGPWDQPIADCEAYTAAHPVAEWNGYVAEVRAEINAANAAAKDDKAKGKPLSAIQQKLARAQYWQAFVTCLAKKRGEAEKAGGA